MFPFQWKTQNNLHIRLILIGNNIPWLKNKNMYVYGWVTWLSTWNYHNIVNQLYSNTKKKNLIKNKK